MGTLAIAATFTAEPLAQPLRFWLDQLKLDDRLEFAPFAQVFQELLDPNSLLGSNREGLNIILVRPRDWLGPAAEDSRELSPAAVTMLEKNVTEFVAALGTATQRTTTPWLVCLCHDLPSTGSLPGPDDRLAAITEHLATAVRETDGVLLITPPDIDALYPVAAYYDAEQDKLASIPYTDLYYTSLATLITRRYYKLATPETKVIALDCDNTLWKGICGEDGAHGVEIDFACRALQAFMKAQYDAGTLLCLCSKNNEADVMEVFHQRTDMPLVPGHFAATRINWKPKSENLLSLSEELGLGLDSFVFIDDDPVECNEVMTRCPAVTTLQLPRQRPLIPAFLQHAWVFDRLHATREAQHRNLLYKQDSRRTSARDGATSLDDFLQGLELSVEIMEMQPENIHRVAELFNRTNQFNATTIRYSENEIRKLFNSKEKHFLVTTAKDRFGDYGLIGVTAWSFRQEEMHIDSLLLSCRALGRRIEHRLLARLARLADDAACKTLVIVYIETARNHLVRDFLDNTGAGSQRVLARSIEYRFPVRKLLCSTTAH